MRSLIRCSAVASSEQVVFDDRADELDLVFSHGVERPRDHPSTDITNQKAGEEERFSHPWAAW